MLYINNEKSEIECRILSAESKPYDFEGNAGVSHKIRISVAGEIIVCNSTEEQVRDYKEFVGKEGTAVIELVTRKETVKFKLLDFNE